MIDKKRYPFTGETGLPEGLANLRLQEDRHLLENSVIGMRIEEIGKWVDTLISGKISVTLFHQHVTLLLESSIGNIYFSISLHKERLEKLQRILVEAHESTATISLVLRQELFNLSQKISEVLEWTEPSMPNFLSIVEEDDEKRVHAENLGDDQLSRVAFELTSVILRYADGKLEKNGSLNKLFQELKMVVSRKRLLSREDITNLESLRETINAASVKVNANNRYRDASEDPNLQTYYQLNSFVCALLGEE